MPNLVAVDVSVTDSRIRLAFSDRAVASAYAAYLRAQDMRPPQYQTIPGYTRAPQLHNTSSKEISLSLPYFITWFITCRLPDDEDSVTFTYTDVHEAYAARWAEEMLLFEPVRESSTNYLQATDGPNASKQLHVRRLWNRAYLLKRLEELRRASIMVTATPPPSSLPLPLSLSPGRRGRSRVGSPTAVWGNGVVNGVNSVVNGVNGVHGGRMPVALTVPGVVQRGDIWW